MTFQFLYSLCATHHKYITEQKKEQTLVKWKLKQQHMQHEWKNKTKKRIKNHMKNYEKKNTQTSFPFNLLFFSWWWCASFFPLRQCRSAVGILYLCAYILYVRRDSAAASVIGERHCECAARRTDVVKICSIRNGCDSDAYRKTNKKRKRKT